MEKSVTTSQVGEIRKMAIEKGVSRQAFQGLMPEFAKLLDGARPVMQRVKLFLRLLYSGVTVGATDGKATFRSSGFYIYYMDPNYCTMSVPTSPVLADVYELVKDAKFTEFLGAFGESRPRWKTEAQIVEFSRSHRDKLRGEGYANFFELEGGFVAYVLVYGDGQLDVFVRPLEDDCVWLARYRHRVVLPQL